MDRAVLIEAHKHGTGGSQIAKVCGFSQWGGKFDVANEILNQVEKPQTLAMERGIRLEPVIADMYFEQHRAEGIRLREPPKPKFSEKYPHALGSADRIVMQSRKAVRGLEIKSPGYRQRNNWGDPQTGVIPREVYCQSQWYAGIFELPHWDVAAWVDTLDYKEYRIDFDEEFFTGMAEANEEFWTDYILKGILPDPFEAANPLEALKVKFPCSVRPLLTADTKLETLAEAYRAALARVTSHQETADSLEADIKAIIADAEGATGEFGKILWRSHGVNRVGWKAVAADYRTILTRLLGEFKANGAPPQEVSVCAGDLAAIETAHTKASTSRPFRPYWAASDDDPIKEKDNG